MVSQSLVESSRGGASVGVGGGGGGGGGGIYQQHISRQSDRSKLSSVEKRYRNRSLCSSLCTPPPYPGYLAVMSSIKAASSGSSASVAVAVSAASSIVDTGCSQSPWRIQPRIGSASPLHHATSTLIAPSSRSDSRPSFCLTPDCEQNSPTDECKTYYSGRSSWNSPRKITTTSKESSGYGSASSESDAENDQSLHTVEEELSGDWARSSRVSMPAAARSRPLKSSLDKSRRRSVPAYLREACFSDEIVRVLHSGGVLQFETDADTGVSTPLLSGFSINRPESVLQLARKFAEAQAAQDNRLSALNQKASIECASSTPSAAGKSHSGPTTPVRRPGGNGTTKDVQRRPGGIECLCLNQMSKTNVFKQLDQINRTNQPQVIKPFNPASVKEALLRWCQHKLHGYPVNVTNFSSSWADGMAFCALIHRFAPDSFNFNALDPRNRRANFELAFRVAENEGIVPLLDVDDMILMGDRPDWKCVFTYVQAFYSQFKDRP